MIKFIDEFRNREMIKGLARQISNQLDRPVRFMEVCGGHTHAIRRFGIRSLIPSGLKLISGPGCPVCVTCRDYIDKAIWLAGISNMIITTFGDLIRVPGSKSSLASAREGGADIRIVLSGLEALDIAVQNRKKAVVFLGIGFETTAPGTAAVIQKAYAQKVSNFYVLSAHKIMPPAMEALLSGGTEIDGFICPGHVAAITGSSIFNFIPRNYNLPCVVTGFEPADMMQAILMLILQVKAGKPLVEIAYNRAVTIDGNLRALRVMNDVFEPSDTEWRGLGVVKNSGLKCRDKYRDFDAELVFNPKVEETSENEICICGEILRGRSLPSDCPAFTTMCTPENPLGACMVSSEGACNAWYKYVDYE